MKYFFPITIVLLLSFTIGAAQEKRENPFVEMARQPYAAYCHKLDCYHSLSPEEPIYKDCHLHDPAWIEQTAAQMREAGKLTGNKKWMIEADYVTLIYHYFRTIRTQNPQKQQVDKLSEELIANLQEIVQRAQKIKATDLQLRAMYRIVEIYFQRIHNDELGFRQAMAVNKELDKVTAGEFPNKPVYYKMFAWQYMQYHEYETARLFYEKILESPDTAYELRLLEFTYNELGLIYRIHYNDLQKSDSCFSIIFNIKPENPAQVSPTADTDVPFKLQDEYELWCAIAKGNLGSNHYLRGEYGQAIPLLQQSVRRVTKDNPYNYPFASGRALILANIYIEQKNLLAAKHYIDTTQIFLTRMDGRDAGIFKDWSAWTPYYKAQSRYYRAMGNNAKALLYADSLLLGEAQLQDDFNLRKLHRAEQRVAQEEFNTEKLRSESYRHNFRMAVVFATIFLLMLGLLFYNYRKKRAAYRALVERIRQWAQVIHDRSPLCLPQAGPVDAGYETIPPEQPGTKTGNHTDSANRALLEQLQQLIENERLYRHHDITLEKIARRMGVSRVYLSQAVNRCTSKNFATFINEYRVKEAVRTLSEETTNLSLEGVAFQSGFNDRKTFYSAFKKITGLSPSEFRNNLQKV
jgi:AraC-like DNA-binding protein